MLNFQEEHSRAVSAVEDGEAHPGDQQSYQHRIRRVTSGCTTAELHSSLAHDIGHVVRSHCPMKWKSWKVMPDEIKTEVRGQLSTNYNLEDLDDESLAYVNRLFSERYKQWKSDLHHYFEAFDDPQVALQEAKVNKGNRKKKTLLHQLGSRPFSYRMDARRQGGSKFPEIDVFGDVYVRPGMSWPSPFIRRWERSQFVLQEPPPNFLRYFDRVCGFSTGCWVSDLDGDIESDSRRRPGTYCQGMGNARRRKPRPRSSAQSNSQVTALTAQVATLQSQM
ncbi:hypothetical protein Prudu_541S000500 [Prunus dulcis]|uniref:Ankyrin repeat family protein n=1 Tax=Prunus dulcis TaxID=3755 RepID=A0A5H2XNW3_PRUDU|nr:hypothetical protein Prudu_541S000500 [Prunus dulcis]